MILKIIKGLSLFIGVYILLVVIGYLSYDFRRGPTYATAHPTQGSSIHFRFDDISLSRNNYASKEIRVSSNSDQVVDVGQKYEKVANLGAHTDQFDEEVKKLRKYIEGSKALIQFEQNSGIEEDRMLSMAIGVHPMDFEKLVSQLKELGELDFFQTDVRDKTNEYNELEANRATQEKYRNSLVALKGNSGKIEEKLNLELKILGVEQTLQTLGVSLGDYDQENEFCTIKFKLKEFIKKDVVENVSEFGLKLWNSVVFATPVFAITVILFGVFMTGLFIALRIYAKLKN